VLGTQLKTSYGDLALLTLIKINGLSKTTVHVVLLVRTDVSVPREICKDILEYLVPLFLFSVIL
jgi:hypothetical protein